MTNFCLVGQEEKLKRPFSHMEAWEIAHTQKNPKPSEAKYYGKTAEKKKAYSEGYLRLHPGTPDAIRADLGGGHGDQGARSGGGYRCCDHSYYLLHTAPSDRPEPEPAHEHANDQCTVIVRLSGATICKYFPSYLHCSLHFLHLVVL